MNKKENYNKVLNRVDVQVSLLAASVVVFSSILIFLIAYRYTYSDTLLSLTERVESIYSYLDEALDPETFKSINSKEDMEKACYKDMKNLFFEIKQATGVEYLYTAKRTEDGQLIYVIDGLDYDAVDFRYPGDLIEDEIKDVLNQALSGERVMPKDIKKTTWGNIFIAYLPIHGGQNQVIGAIGIEFAADHQYMTYLRLRQLIPLVILATCIFSAVIALILFRRLSNPHFQDLANTDWLTGLKNRNAYELDSRNLTAKGAVKGMGLLLADLNGLKRINDTLGHEAGDMYIKRMADSLLDAQGGNEIMYRIGGDEFVVLVPGATEFMLEAFVEKLNSRFDERDDGSIPHASFSIGYTICEDVGTRSLEKAYIAADKAMYERKQNYYAQSRVINM